MAADMNVWAVTCRLTRDPEMRETTGGTPVASLRVAWTTRTRGAEGWEDAPNYMDVTVFGRQAQAVCDHTSKGSRVALTGRIEWREYVARDGQKRQVISAVATDVVFLAGAGERSAAGGGGGHAASYDDVPF